MPLSVDGPRLLLRRLRQVMLEETDRQTRLNRIVELIATSMNTAVCSVYLKRDDVTLELCATEGLKPEAVHQTSLRVGEGLVGDIAQHARPLNLSDAQTHPRFAYRPETGEERFHSFVGVPVLRGGTLVGVLVAQNTTYRSFIDEEVEALQTVAMVLAEMLAESGELDADETARAGPRRFQGQGFTGGMALGHVVLHEPRVAVSRLIADDEEAEQVRLEAAVYELRRLVDELLLKEDVSHAGEHLDVLETYRMFANDEGWLARMREAVRTGLTAEAAVERVQGDMHARLMGQRDVYLRERLHDFEDLTNRLLRILTGRPVNASADRLPKNAILVARGMGPAELLDYERKHLRGLILEEGSQSAHVAIVARALGIPMVGRVLNIVDLAHDGQEIILDADTGACFLDPSAEMIESYAERAKINARRQKRYARVRKLPAITRDGQKIDVLMNAGLLVDLKNLTDSGADGIGLFRTELQFMVSAKLPRIEEQALFYRHVFDQAGDKSVTFRTLDIGGDKVLPYMRHTHEENPAMGWRAIRIALDRPGLLRYQLRSLLQASAGKELNIMFPMIAEIDEFVKAKDLLDKEVARLAKFHLQAPAKVRVGTMLEVPSLVWQLEELLPLMDFISIGTNDLMQFFFASDRGNPQLSERYDILSPAPMAMLKQISDACQRHGVDATICGEIAGRPLDAMAMLAMGYSRFSMPSASVGPVKRMVRSVNLGKLRHAFGQVLQQSSQINRAQIENIAKSLKIKL
ncbi:MAG: phosphoenolpyruvate--protein phosphotransferase [Parvibaculales bacterium]